MPIIQPENQWPPLLPHNEGGDMAWREVWVITKDILQQSRRSTAHVLNKSDPADLILEIRNSPNEARPFIIVHGLERPRTSKNKQHLKHPLWIEPAHVSIDMLNNINRLDRIQLAQILSHQYAGDLWEAEFLEKEISEQEQIDERSESNNPWTSQSAWEKSLQTLDGDITTDEEGKDEEESSADTIDDEIADNEDMYEYLAFMKSLTNLQLFYRTLVLGQLHIDV